MRAWLVALIALLGGCAGTTTPDSEIPITVSKPDGPGPFPAVVIMHDCSGLGVRSSGSPNRWAKELVRHGYVVAIPDSFTPRGHADGLCTTPVLQRNADSSPPRRARDAHVALMRVRGLPYVDGERVGIMGGSHGGTTTLLAMTAPASVASEKGAVFAAAVALYPGCAQVRAAYRPVAAPVLILIGEKDDWTPAEPCRKLTDAARAAGYPVTIQVYPGAHHSFDSPYPVRYVAERINANAPQGRGATTGGDPGAWGESIRDVEAFFREHLMSTKR